MNYGFVSVPSLNHPFLIPPSPPKRYTITLSYLNKGKHDLMTVKPTEINVPWFPAQGLGGAFSFPSQ